MESTELQECRIMKCSVTVASVEPGTQWKRRSEKHLIGSYNNRIVALILNKNDCLVATALFQACFARSHKVMLHKLDHQDGTKNQH